MMSALLHACWFQLLFAYLLFNWIKGALYLRWLPRVFTNTLPIVRGLEKDT